MQKVTGNTGDFVREIERILDQSNITLEFISLETKVSRPNISNYMSGRVPLSFTYGQRVLQAVGGDIVAMIQEPVNRPIAEFSLKFGDLFYGRFWTKLYKAWKAANDFAVDETMSTALTVPFPCFTTFVNTGVLSFSEKYYYFNFPDSYKHLSFKGLIEQESELPAKDKFNLCGIMAKPIRKKKNPNK